MGTEQDAPPAEAVPGDIDEPTLITPRLLRDWSLPDPVGTKYSRGQVVVVGGARRTPGAAMLAGVAALRMGAGRLTLAVAESVAPHVAVSVPESGVHGLVEDDSGSITGAGVGELLQEDLARADAVLVGPGLDDAEGTVEILEQLIRTADDADGPSFVLDAYGATVLPQLDRAAVDRLAGRVIVTPNETELAILVDAESLDAQDIPKAAREVVERYDARVACSGWILCRDGAWQVTAGDTGLGTSGSGDVLAGAVSGLVSRGATAEQALVWGAYVHAAAGDNLASKLGRIGYLAGDLLPELPLVLAALRGD